MKQSGPACGSASTPARKTVAASPTGVARRRHEWLTLPATLRAPPAPWLSIHGTDSGAGSSRGCAPRRCSDQAAPGGPGEPRGRRRGGLGDHDGESGALEQPEPPGAVHGEDDGVEAFSVSASASYTCCCRQSPPPSSLSLLSVEQGADNVLENENCRDKNVVNGANFLIDLKVPLYREITT